MSHGQDSLKEDNRDDMGSLLKGYSAWQHCLSCAVLQPHASGRRQACGSNGAPKAMSFHSEVFQNHQLLQLPSDSLEGGRGCF